MVVSRDEIFEWVQAPEVREALVGVVPESGALHAIVVEDRKDLVRIAAGVCLLEHHERATQEAEIAQTALRMLGFTAESSTPTPEEEPDKLLTLQDFESQGFSAELPTRVWNALIREYNDLIRTQERLENPDLEPESKLRLESNLRSLRIFEGLFVEGKISLRKLKKLSAHERHRLTDLRNFGNMSLALVDKVAEIEIED